MGSVSCLDPSAFLLASPQQVNPSRHSLAAAGVSALGSILSFTSPPPTPTPQNKGSYAISFSRKQTAGKCVAGKT